MADQSVHPALKPGIEDVQFVLNGREVVGKKGETIIAVAAREGVYVPHYCWHPALSVAGNCRLCLVELHMPNPRDPSAKPAPLPKPVIACQTPITPGMHVFTESKLARECQDGMMEFLLANHPLDCPICDRGGECQLQRYSMEYGQGHARMADQKRRFVKPQADPLIDIERNRCIMCTRCVRFCDEIAGEHVMGVFDRGEGNYIGTFGQGPVANILSGNVIDICPVGCLTSKPFRFKARPWELLQTQSTSVWDSSGAKVTHWSRNGKLYRTTPPSRKMHDRYTINEDSEEFIDNITRFGSDFSQHERRWDESRIRIGGTLLPAAFVEAVKNGAAGLAKVKATHGANSIATIVSPRATMEEGYLAAKFARNVLGNDNIDWRMSFQTAEGAEAAALAFDHADGDMDGGFDAVVFINGDYLHQTPVFASRVKEHARLNNKPIILVGHHHDVYLAPHSLWKFHCAPGDTARTLDQLAKALKGDQSATDQLLKSSGGSAADFDRLKKIIGGAFKKGLIVQSLEDMNGSLIPTEVPAAIAFRQAMGEAWKYMPVLRDRNAFGLHAVGAQPKSGNFSARRLVHAIESGEIKGLLALGADALYSFPDKDRMLKALGLLEFFVVTDLFDSAITQKAHVFIAAASNLERSGTFCDLEGNLARLQEVEGVGGGARPDWETLTGMANVLGAEDFNYETVEDVFNEMMASVAPGFKGSFKGLRLAGPRNDFSVSDPGGARLRLPAYNPGDYRTDGAHFRWTGERLDVSASSSKPSAAPAGQFLLTWGEHVQGDDYHLNHASISHLLQIGPYAEVNRADAKRLGIEARQHGYIRIGNDDVEVELIVCDGPAPGVLYMPSGLSRVKMSGYKNALPVELGVIATAPRVAELSAV
ncbi:NADH-quinone oxidoreductase subunit NuoG [soil metagenome]